MERATADHMGMLATVMNALALADALRRTGIEPRVMTAIEMRAWPSRTSGAGHPAPGEGPDDPAGAGTGNPYFTTDTAAALRAMEINAEVLIKATKVDGVYDKDPKNNPDAKRFDRLTYIEALNLAPRRDGQHRVQPVHGQRPADHRLDLWQPGSLEQACSGQPVGTIVSA